MDKRKTRDGIRKNEWDLTGKLNRVTTLKGNYVFITDYEYYRIVPSSDIYGKIIPDPYIRMIPPEFLAKVIKASGLSKTTIAEAVGIDRGTLYYIMWGRTKSPSVETLSNLYKLFNGLSENDLPYVKVLNHKVIKDLMYEFEIRNKDIVQHVPISSDTVSRIKNGDNSVGYLHYQAMSNFVMDHYQHISNYQNFEDWHNNKYDF
tara:strand:+ start:1845 stop:2456 length:612 start_codon:yes stop_codon:yes gene_type:complete